MDDHPTYKCIYPTYKSVNPTYNRWPSDLQMCASDLQMHISDLLKCKSDLQLMTIRPTNAYVSDLLKCKSDLQSMTIVSIGLIIDWTSVRLDKRSFWLTSISSIKLIFSIFLKITPHQVFYKINNLMNRRHYFQN